MVSGRKVLPWTDTNSQMEQERFILATLEGREKFSSVCRALRHQPEDGVQAPAPL